MLSRLAITSQVKASAAFSQFTWTCSAPEIVQPSNWLVPLNRPDHFLALKAGLLTPGTTYIFTLTAAMMGQANVNITGSVCLPLLLVFDTADLCFHYY